MFNVHSSSFCLVLSLKEVVQRFGKYTSYRQLDYKVDTVFIVCMYGAEDWS